MFVECKPMPGTSFKSASQIDSWELITEVALAEATSATAEIQWRETGEYGYGNLKFDGCLDNTGCQPSVSIFECLEYPDGPRFKLNLNTFDNLQGNLKDWKVTHKDGLLGNPNNDFGPGNQYCFECDQGENGSLFNLLTVKLETKCSNRGSTIKFTCFMQNGKIYSMWKGKATKSFKNFNIAPGGGCKNAWKVCIECWKRGNLNMITVKGLEADMS